MIGWILIVAGIVTFLAGPAFASWTRCLFMDDAERKRYLEAWFRARERN